MDSQNKKAFKTYLPLAVLIIIYLISRLYGLTASTMNSLEATWIHWAQIVLQFPNEWLIAGNSGQQPLFTWLNAITLSLFSDPLLAGRLVSVLAGLVSMTGLYGIGRSIYNRTAGLLAAFVYIVFPYTYFFDRLALPAGLLTAMIIWMFHWFLHIAQQTRPPGKSFRFLGILMGASLLTYWIAVWTFPVLFALFYTRRVHHRPEFWIQCGTSIAIALVMNLPVVINTSYEESGRLRYDQVIQSGAGVREAARYLAQEGEGYRGKTGVPLPVMLPIALGHPSEGIAVYLWKNPDIRLVPAFWWPKSPKLIPTGVRFSHRPSIYQTYPVKRRETALLSYAHFIFPTGVYSREKFVQENPRFEIAWSSQKKIKRSSIVIFKNRPHK